MRQVARHPAKLLLTLVVLAVAVAAHSTLGAEAAQASINVVPNASFEAGGCGSERGSHDGGIAYETEKPSATLGNTRPRLRAAAKEKR
jgi:hypothetical protein